MVAIRERATAPDSNGGSISPVGGQVMSDGVGLAVSNQTGDVRLSSPQSLVAFAGCVGEPQMLADVTNLPAASQTVPVDHRLHGFAVAGVEIVSAVVDAAGDAGAVETGLNLAELGCGDGGHRSTLPDQSRHYNHRGAEIPDFF